MNAVGRLILIVATLQLQLPVCLWVNASRSDHSKTVAKKHSCCCGCCHEETTTNGDESTQPKDPNRDSCPCHYQCCLCSPGYVPLSAPMSFVASTTPMDRVMLDPIDTLELIAASRLDRPPRV